MIIPGFIGPSYVSTSPNVAIEILNNLYPQTVEVPNEKARIAYFPTPGLSLFSTLPTTPVRGLFNQDSVTLAVGGSVLYSLDALGNHTTIGSLSASDSSPVTFNSSGTAGHQVYITSGGAGNIYDTVANAVTPITAAGYPSNTVMGTYLDTYFLTTKGQSAQFNISNLLDGTLWSNLDFAVRIAASDNLVGIIQNNKLIWLIGSQTSEPWYDAGISSFPYQAVPQVLVNVGCCAPFSITQVSANGNSSVVMLHKSLRGQGEFVIIESYIPQRFSTFAQEAIWSTYPTLTDCVAYAYTDQGHDFLVATFPSGNAQWVYDFQEQMWHQRSWWNVATGNADRPRQWVHCLSNGKHLVGDWQNGNIYVQDTTLPTDNGALIRRQRASPHSSNEQKYEFYSDFQLDMETGLGTTVSPGADPTVLLQWSDDGGHTWSQGIFMSAGTRGNYKTRCMARGNLGRSRDRVWRVTVSDPIPWRWIQAYMTASPGTN